MDYIVLDFETTGAFRGNENIPWQLGVVRMCDRRIVPADSFGIFLQVPTHHQFNPYAPGRWAAMREELSHAPTLLELWPQLQPWLGGHVLVAHHVPTERSLLTRIFPMHQFGPWIDTLELSRQAYPRQKSHQLEELIPNLGLKERLDTLCPGRSPHDALYDAFASALLLEHLLEQEGWNDCPDEDLFVRQK